jgi:hypothetical protein
MGAQLLKTHTGINGLHFESALVDPTVPPGIVTISGGRPGEPCVRVLSVFSNEDTSYESRPSQEQVNRLSRSSQDGGLIMMIHGRIDGKQRVRHLYKHKFDYLAATPIL